VLGWERLTGDLLDRLTHHVHILEMNGESYGFIESNRNSARQACQPITNTPVTPFPHVAVIGRGDFRSGLKPPPERRRRSPL